MQIIMEGRASPTKSIIETSANFFAKELGLSRSRFTLLIMTEKGMARREGMRGAVHKVGPKFITMIIDSGLEFERLIITLAHEMVHVKQYARGQIKPSRSCKTHYWMGQHIRKSYYDQPWEIEAYTKERVLANKIFAITGA